MRRKRAVIFFGLSMIAAAGAVAVRYHASAKNVMATQQENPWLSPPENVGDFAAPLTRKAPAYDPSKPPSRPWVDASRAAPAPMQYRRYRALAINGQETDYLVYLPPGYGDAANAKRRYPVVYWLHGYDSEPQDGAPFVEGLDAAIRAGAAPPMIVIIPNGLKDSWFVDSADGSQPVESIILHDLIPHVDRTYRTIANRRGRAVEGFSMGAWGAIHLAFKYPELFGTVTGLSPPFHRHDRFWQLGRIFNNDASAYYAEDPVTRARRDPQSLRGLRIRLFCGEKDQLGSLAYDRMFERRLTEWGVTHDPLVVLPGVGHSAGDLYDAMGAKAFAFYKSAFE